MTAAQADVTNGDFSDPTGSPWYTYGTTSAGIVEGQYCTTATSPDPWDAGFVQEGIALSAGLYSLNVEVDGDDGNLAAQVFDAASGDDVMIDETTITIAEGTGAANFEFVVNADTEAAKLVFQVGSTTADVERTLCFSSVSITQVPTERVVNGDFADGEEPWITYGTSAAGVVEGAFCTTVTSTDPWDAGLIQEDMVFTAGPATLSLDVTGPDGNLAAQIIDAASGGDVIIAETQVAIADGEGTVEFDFTVPADTESGKINFQIGSTTANEERSLCIDNVSIMNAGGTGGEPVIPNTNPPGVNLVANGDFEDGSVNPWWSYGTDSLSNVDGQMCSTSSGANRWDAGLGNNGIDMGSGSVNLTFTATGTGTSKVVVEVPDEGTEVLGQEFTVNGTQTFSYDFVVPEAAAGSKLLFEVGGLEICFDDIFLGRTAVQYITNGTFDDDVIAPWAFEGIVPDSARIENGALCVDVPGGTGDPWNVIVRHNDIFLPADDYTLTFDASGVSNVRGIVGQQNAPYAVRTEVTGVPGPDLVQMGGTFATSADEEELQVAFQVGGATNPWTFCVDNVSLVNGHALPPYAPETGPDVRVNQHGYEVDGPKFATLVTEETTALAWELTLAGDDTAVAQGTSVPQGVDPSAGLNVHVIDFAGDYAPGTYELHADGDTSWEFEIGTGLYNQMRYDALNYFYLARSGIEIEESIVGPEYARPAGHASEAGGDDVNQGDYNVACQPASESEVVYGVPWTCDYTLDVVGGWYDAGDHGKYVVNGGISVFQVMATYERGLYADSAVAGALGDSTLNLPETGNEVPDVLDEARWQLEFMQSMMVPEGEDLEGMVHHKIHDFGWTGLPLLPHLSSSDRYLHRPSTAATLNLAATAAQGARLFLPFDSDYSAELLADAETAWAAALETPDLYATAADGANGGGPYDDTHVDDEFYWAAVQLYLTTGAQEYEDFILASPVHTADVFAGSGFNWKDVGALGRMDLALIPNNLPGRDAVIASVIAGADAIVATQQDQPFGQAYSGTEDGTYEWGSNSLVLNNMVVVGTAYDLTGDQQYVASVRESMDYLLGRNALNMSYITGYGTQFAQNQHSRWFANQLNAELPNPPAGSVAGGPNSDFGTWDPVIQGLYPDQDCAPQVCYVDEIQSWATNEITINWNASLSWVASFLDSDFTAQFSDVPTTHTFFGEIKWLTDEGITTGFADGTFRPGANVTRQAMAAFLYRAAGAPAYTAPAVSPFSDVSTSHTFYDEIAWLADAEITQGFADGTFRPNAPITRQAMSAFLYRFADEPAYTAPAVSPFPDVNTSHTFYHEIAWMSDAEISTGFSDGTFRPNADVTRQAMAAFLQRVVSIDADV